MRLSELSYREVGMTLTNRPLPDGYRHLRYRTRLGSGPEVFAAAAEAVLTWRMHRAIGVEVTASEDRASVGVRVSIRLGCGRLALHAPCVVVGTVDEPILRGFAYGTQDGHPERGEEAFLVELTPDSQVWFTVTAFSRPGRWYTRATARLVPVFQHLYARRCGQVLRALAVG